MWKIKKLPPQSKCVIVILTIIVENFKVQWTGFAINNSELKNGFSYWNLQRFNYNAMKRLKIQKKI